MPIHTALTRRLGVTHPIIQAPMGGGALTHPGDDRPRAP